MTKRRLQIQLTDADGLALLKAPALLILDITKKDITTGGIGSVLERLHVLTDTRESVIRFRESLVFQVGGFDNDRRELPEVAEVRAFFRALTDAWPRWPWFLARRMGAWRCSWHYVAKSKSCAGSKGMGPNSKTSTNWGLCLLTSFAGRNRFSRRWESTLFRELAGVHAREQPPR